MGAMLAHAMPLAGEFIERRPAIVPDLVAIGHGRSSSTWTTAQKPSPQFAAHAADRSVDLDDMRVGVDASHIDEASSMARITVR